MCFAYPAARLGLYSRWRFFPFGVALGRMRSNAAALLPPSPTLPGWRSTWRAAKLHSTSDSAILPCSYSKRKDKRHNPSVAPHVTHTPPVTCQFHRRSSRRRFVRIRPTPHHQIGHPCRRHVPPAVRRRPGAEVCRSCRRWRRSEGSHGLGCPAHNPQPPTISRRQQQTRYRRGSSRFLLARRG